MRVRALAACAALFFTSYAEAAEVYVGAAFTQSLQREELHGFGVAGGVLFSAGSSLWLGPEVAWTSLGTQITDVSTAGTGYDRWREEYTTHLWHATATAVLRSSGDGVRPYARAGLGAFVFRTRDEITYFNAGAEVPELHFEQHGSETRLGGDLGGGARIPFAHSGWGLALEGRWRVAFAGSSEGIYVHHLASVSAAFSYLR